MLTEYDSLDQSEEDWKRRLAEQFRLEERSSFALSLSGREKEELLNLIQKAGILERFFDQSDLEVSEIVFKLKERSRKLEC